MPASVRVEGLRELRMALGAVDAQLEQELRDELKGIANEVAVIAKGRMASAGAVGTGRAMGSIRAFSTARSAGVRAGGARVPYYGWLDFGGTIRHHGSRHEHTQTHLIRREFIAQGRFVYPAADQGATRAAPRVERLLDRLFVKAGFND